MNIKYAIAKKQTNEPMFILVSKYPKPIRESFPSEEEFYEVNIAWGETLESYSVRNEEDIMKILFKEITKDMISIAGDGGLKFKLIDGIPIDPDKVLIKEEKVFGTDVAQNYVTGDIKHHISHISFYYAALKS